MYFVISRDVDGVSTTHRQTCYRTVLFISDNTETAFYIFYYFREIQFEISRTSFTWKGLVLKLLSPGAAFIPECPLRHHHNHRFRFSLSYQIIQYLASSAEMYPFVFISSHAMKQIEYRIISVWMFRSLPVYRHSDGENTSNLLIYTNNWWAFRVLRPLRHRGRLYRVLRENVAYRSEIAIYIKDCWDRSSIYRLQRKHSCIIPDSRGLEVYTQRLSPSFCISMGLFLQVRR